MTHASKLRFQRDNCCRREKHGLLHRFEITDGTEHNKWFVILYYIKENVCHAVTLPVRLSDDYQRLNYQADWAQTVYRCQVGPDDGFRLGPIPIGR